MSSLIKSNNNGHGFIIQNLSKSSATSVDQKRTPQANVENPLVSENQRLIALLEMRDNDIAEHDDALAKAFFKGEAAGRVAMAAEIDDDRSAALILLGDGIEAARSGLGQALENAESIALMVAQLALDKIFGETEARKAAVIDLIRYQFRQIGHDSFVSLEVSRVDFPSTIEVAELATSMSIASDKVRVNDDMEAGDCRMRMKLGTLEIGLSRQWGAIRTLLTDMAIIDESEAVE